MKLILKEYLSLLKESKELDALLPDLLLSMGLEPLIYPKIGTRQYGVDLVAVGNIESEVETLFIFTIKQGNITRNDWDSTEQSVRQSLNEIKDVYLNSCLRPEHKTLRKCIILCTGGILESNVDPNWKNYIEQNSIDGEIEYDFWGGDKLSLLIEKYMLNENIFLPDIRSKFRKTLVKLTDTDYNFLDYYNILDDLLISTEYNNLDSDSAKKKVKKIFRSINLSLNILFYWAKQEDNLKPALVCSERTILNAWEFLRENNLFEKKWIISLYLDVIKTFEKIYDSYLEQLKEHFLIVNSFSGYHSDFILESLNIFEQIGFINNFFIYRLFIIKENKFLNNNPNSSKELKYYSDILKSLINNNKTLLNPVYDNHINEISSIIYYLAELEEVEFIKQYISDVFEHIWYAYFIMGKYFPIYSDSFDDLVSLNISGNIEKEKMMEISSLIPTLAEWCVVLNFKELYEEISLKSNKYFSKCTMQIYFPDNETDNFLYKTNASTKSGLSEAPLKLVGFEEMKKRISKKRDRFISSIEFSANKYSFPALLFIAFRHFRTPMFPIYWYKFND